MTTNETVERAIIDGVESQQDKYDKTSDETSFGYFSVEDVLYWWDHANNITKLLDKRPRYSSNTRELDRWIQDFLMLEPHLKGVIEQAVLIASSRSYTLTGGVIGVNAARRILEGADCPNNQYKPLGYRHTIEQGARSFYTTCMGGVWEVGRLGRVATSNGIRVVPPMGAIWSADPTRFEMTGNVDKPIIYWSNDGKQEWEPHNFFRVTANIDIREEMKGVGFSPALMCAELAKILIAVAQYDLEQLGAVSPKGLLLLQGISEEAWKKAMMARKKDLQDMERQFYGGVSVLASGKAVGDVDAKLIALSQLPAEFNRAQMIETLIYLYALALGFPPDEFWPVRGATFSRASEAQIGLERASTKGDANFLTAFQYAFQQEISSTVTFEYEQRDDRGRQTAAQTDQTYAQTAVLLYEAGAGTGGDEERLFDKRMVYRYLIDNGVITADYLDAQGEFSAEGTDRLERMRRDCLRDKRVWRSAILTPQEPLICYRWDARTLQGQVSMLYDRCDDILRPRVWQGHDSLPMESLPLRISQGENNGGTDS